MSSGSTSTPRSAGWPAGYPDYPAWVPLLFHSFTLGAAVAAVAQRGDATLQATALMALALFPYVVCELISPRMVPWPMFALLSLGALGVLMWQYPVDLDFAVLAAAMIVGRFGALESMRRSGLVCAFAFAGLVALGTDTRLRRHRVRDRRRPRRVGHRLDPAVPAAPPRPAAATEQARARGEGRARGAAADRARGARRHRALAQRHPAAPDRGPARPRGRRRGRRGDRRAPRRRAASAARR